MNQFELSTLAVVALLLLAVGAYSYAQIFRAQKRINATRKLQSTTNPSVPEVMEHHDLSQNYVTAAAYGLEVETPEPAFASNRVSAEFDDNFDDSAVQVEEPLSGAQTVNELNTHATVVEVDWNEPTPIIAVREPDDAQVQMTALTNVDSVNVLEKERVQAVETTQTAEVVQTDEQTDEQPEQSEQSEPHVADIVIEQHFVPVQGSAVDNAQVVANVPTDAPATAQPSSTPSNTAPTLATLTATSAPITSMQELAERASWAVFAPWMRFESWLNTAYPEGVDVVDSIDGVIDITIAQPKITQDIEQALLDLQLNTELPIRLYGARSGQVSMDAKNSTQRTRQWEQLEVGAPYSALRLSLQLANRTHCVNEALLQDWFALAEKLRKRLAGQIERLPDVAQLAEHARYLHGMARRLGQPIIIQLHKKNGLWPAYEIHQQLSACGAVLNESGVYLVRESASQHIDKDKKRTPLYTVMNDVNNPRALDFFRDQMAMMHVHTVSFCLEFARVDADLNPLQRMCEDARHVADALDAQWQNTVGDVISAEALLASVDARAQAFNELLNTLGLPAGALMTKRLLAQ